LYEQGGSLATKETLLEGRILMPDGAGDWVEAYRGEHVVAMTADPGGQTMAVQLEPSERKLQVRFKDADRLAGLNASWRWSYDSILEEGFLAWGSEDGTYGREQPADEPFEIPFHTGAGVVVWAFLRGPESLLTARPFVAAETVVWRFEDVRVWSQQVGAVALAPEGPAMHLFTLPHEDGEPVRDWEVRVVRSQSASGPARLGVHAGLGVHPYYNGECGLYEDLMQGGEELVLHPRVKPQWSRVEVRVGAIPPEACGLQPLANAQAVHVLVEVRRSFDPECHVWAPLCF
jgi:hypothetical protein